jgi:simple sugar transport system ATP-binding protein
VPDLSLSENTLLAAASTPGLVAHGFIDRGASERFATEIVKGFDVRTAGIEHAARSLSGGNLQKFVVGREVLRGPKVLIVAQPTWGVDAGATAAIHQALLDLAAKGCAIVVISQDLDELFALSTRIAVIAHGRISPPMPIGVATIEDIGRAMGGASMAKKKEPVDV